MLLLRGNRRFLALLISGLSVAIAGCPSRHQSWDQLPPGAVATAFRAVVALADSAGFSVTAYCVGYERSVRDPRPPTDPSPHVLRELGEHSPTFRPIHECSIGRHGDVARDTGRPVLAVMLGGPIEWRGDTLLAQAWYHCGGLCARGGQLYLWPAGSAWRARIGGIMWVS